MRKTGQILCGAKHKAEEDDCYIDDGIHYLLAVEAKVVVPDPKECINGLWHWCTKSDSVKTAYEQGYSDCAEKIRNIVANFLLKQYD